MEKIKITRDYFDILFEEDSLRELGFADGFIDFENDAENIAFYSYRLKGSIDIAFECTRAYMEGYDVGSFMSENSVDIYDEDGNLKDDYDIEPNVYEQDVQHIINKVL